MIVGAAFSAKRIHQTNQIEKTTKCQKNHGFFVGAVFLLKQNALNKDKFEK